MVTLVTCKNEENPIKTEGARVLTAFLPLYGNFFRRTRAAHSAVRGRIRQNLELIQDIIVVFLTCKNKEDPIKNKGPRVLTRLYINFSHTQGQLTPQSVVESHQKIELIQAFIVVLVTCKNGDPIKNKGARVLTTFLPI